MAGEGSGGWSHGRGGAGVEVAAAVGEEARRSGRAAFSWCSSVPVTLQRQVPAVPLR